MSFWNFFMDYEIKVLTIDKWISIKDIEKPRLLWCVFLCVEVIVVIGLLFAKKIDYRMAFTIIMITVMVTFCWLERKEEKRKSLEKYYKPHSKIRMEALIELLSDYGIDYKDEIKINRLIEQVELEKIEMMDTSKTNCFIGSASKYLFIPVLILVVTRLINDVDAYSLFLITAEMIMIIVALIGTWYIVEPLVHWTLHGEERKLNRLKRDLQQLLIFYV